MNGIILRRASALVLLVVVSSVVSGIVMLQDNPPGPVRSPMRAGPGEERMPLWPEGIEDLVNSRPIVRLGDGISSSAIYYAGGTDAFNDFVRRYGALEGIPLEVILHVGPKTADLPGSASASDANWMLSIESSDDAAAGKDGKWPVSTRIDLWLGGAIKLDGLGIPPNVVVRSAREIETFIETHERNRQIWLQRKQGSKTE